MAKRIFDIIAAALLLLLTLPLIILIAIGVRLLLGSPVLFVQKRPGLHGQLFEIYKFRTMLEMRDDQNCLLPDEARLTRLGRILRALSLDELPELFNVLKGDMSLVGPRPLLPDYLPLYSNEQQLRHAVKPGLTGLAQVSGRNSLDWEDRFRLDLWYVRHQSLLLDLKILGRTIGTVLSRRGISHSGEATMRRFDAEARSRPNSK